MSSSSSSASAAAAASGGPIALIGGSSFLDSTYLSSFQLITVDTPFGAVKLYHNPPRTLYFVQRHAASTEHAYSPPHLINHRANIHALHQLGCTQVIAFGSVGSLKKALPVGSLVVPDDFYDPDPITFFDYEKRGHIGPSFDAPLRQDLIDTLMRAQFPVITQSTYTQTRGPRFETPAEIRMLALVGDLVGMTCAHEATLCKELALPYAVICMVDNMANGLADKNLSYEEFHAGVKRNLVVMEKVLGTIIDTFGPRATPIASAAGSASSTRQHVDQIVYARFIVCVEPDQVLERHALIVHQGKIVAILPADQVDAHYVSASIERLDEHVLMPGLVNCHTHVGMTLMRGFADDHCLHEWLTEHIWPAEREFVTPKFVADSTELAFAEMIRGGTTSFNDMYWFPDTICELTDKAGLRAVIGLIVLDFPSAWASSITEYVDKGLQVRKTWAHHDRINFAVAPHAPYTVCDENLAKVKQLSESAQSGGHRVHTHLHETAAEVEDSVNNVPGPNRHRSEFHCRPIENLNRLGLLSPELIAVHMTQLIPSDIALLAKTHAHVVHCPSSNMKLASGFCPITDLTSASVNVALGTDSSASNNKLDMWTEMRTAALVAKGVSRRADAIPAHQALKLATINGARALGLDQQIGSLQAGKAADFIAVRLDDIETLPLFDVVSHLVYACSREHVTDVWVAGRRLLRNRALVTLDEKRVKEQARSWQQRLLAFKVAQAKAKNPNAQREIVTEPAASIIEAPASELVNVSANPKFVGGKNDAMEDDEASAKRRRVN